MMQIVSNKSRFLKQANLIRRIDYRLIGREGGSAEKGKIDHNDDRQLDEEIPQRRVKEVHDFGGSKRVNCAVFATGLSSTGALALPKLVKYVANSNNIIFRPKRVVGMDARRIKRVAAGCGFSLFASRTDVFGSGLNNFYQLCGPRRKDEERKEVQISEETNRGEAPYWFIEGKRIPLPEDCGNIRCISAGRMHSVVLTDKSKIFCFGSNTHGQCGADPIQFPAVTHNVKLQLHPVKMPTDQEIVQVHACLDTTFALAKGSGQIYAWGLGTDGQLGNGNRNIQWQPELVGGDVQGEQIVRLGGTVDTLIATSEKGDVFVWGQNEYGQQGALYDDTQIFFPRHVPFNLGKVTFGDATGSSCIICNSDGHVFTWGSQILGFGPKVERLERPMQLDPPLFASAMRDDGRVIKVYAGVCSMGAVTETGQMFTWGANRHGTLAVGHKNHQYFPYQVSFAEPVRNASLGPHHSLFVTNRY